MSRRRTNVRKPAVRTGKPVLGSHDRNTGRTRHKRHRPFSIVLNSKRKQKRLCRSCFLFYTEGNHKTLCPECRAQLTNWW